jgi:hypothetical protein
MRFKTGKLPVQFHPKTLCAERYFGEELLSPPPGAPPIPEKVYWGYKVPADQWGMLGNDVAGCCVIAKSMHMIMNWTAHTGMMKTFTTEQALGLYTELTGYDPITGANDTGLVMSAFYEYWQTTGIYGDKLLGWASFNSAAPNRFNQIIWGFGTAGIGVRFPDSAMTQFNAGEAWSVVPGPTPTEGHALPFFNFGSQGKTCDTWSKLQGATDPWLLANTDEAYAPIHVSWFDMTTGMSPSHFNRDQLWADLKTQAA